MQLQNGPYKLAKFGPFILGHLECDLQQKLIILVQYVRSDINKFWNDS